ncbi:MAG TPA: TolC family outer membrane protein, partial [Caulobacteraceae bacterium]|nr:TolC family outer membrane protein [Caulobacteraceae bacterium]
MTIKNFKRWAVALPSAAALSVAAFGPAYAIDLRDAVEAAVASNPQINQAAQNKQAIEFERKQAQGLYLPRVDLELSGGVRKLENPTRRTLGLDDETLQPLEAGLTVQQTLWDSGARRSELERQASRTDGAANRVEERSEFIALEVVRSYLNYLLQQRLVAVADDNVTFHDTLAGDLRQGASQGSISIADQQQAEERLQSARVRRTEAQEDLADAGIEFMMLTGIPIDSVTMPPPVTANLPTSLDQAVELARTQNPLVREALADVDAAHAVVRAARAELGPKISLEGRARTGEDIDGFAGDTTDLQALLVMRWTLFSGGINQANVQEQVRRVSEERYRLHEASREAETDVRSAWNRRDQQSRLLVDLETQSRISDDLLLSYREQFNVGRRSLLDVLDAENTRHNVQVQRETARFAALFAEYKMLAATNQLLKTMNIAPPKDAFSDARARFNVEPTPPAELMA